MNFIYYYAVGRSNVASVVKSVRKGEFCKNLAIGSGCERLVGPRMESHPVISGASHCLIGEDVCPYLRRREICTVVVKLNEVRAFWFVLSSS